MVFDYVSLTHQQLADRFLEQRPRHLQLFGSVLITIVEGSLASSSSELEKHADRHPCDQTPHRRNPCYSSTIPSFFIICIGLLGLSHAYLNNVAVRSHYPCNRGDIRHKKQVKSRFATFPSEPAASRQGFHLLEPSATIESELPQCCSTRAVGDVDTQLVELLNSINLKLNFLSLTTTNNEIECFHLRQNGFFISRKEDIALPFNQW